MVRLTVTINACPHGARDIFDAFRFLRVGTLLEPGCLGCSAWTDTDSTVHYVEEWATECDVRRHVRSDRFTSLLTVLESAKDPPQVQFDFVTTTRGLDFVAEVREQTGE
jgi:quinol monooxygenase YgiN